MKKKFLLLLIPLSLFILTTVVLSRPIGPGEGMWMHYEFNVTVTDPDNNPVSGVNLRMKVFYQFWENYEWVDYLDVTTGVTNSVGFASLEIWVDVTEYWPDNYNYQHIYVEITDPEYTVLADSGTYSTQAFGSAYFIVAPDLNNNNVYDNFEASLAQKFSPIYKFHQNNPLFPMPVEAVFGDNNPTLLNNNDPNNYLPLPITSHNPDEWNNYFFYVLKPNFESGPYSPTVYFQIFRMNIQEYNGSVIPYFVIQYWVYYPYDDAANVHESDFEHIDVIVNDQDPSVSQGVGAVYYRHNTSRSYTWNQLETINTHPVIYVGGFESVRPIGKPNKTRPGHEITGASFAAPGMHYSVDYPKTLLEGLIWGIVTWRADENVIPNRELNYNDYFLINMTLPQPLWWMGYPGYWGADPSTVRSTTPYEVIRFELPFVWGEFDFPQFSEPPKSPSHKPDKWQKIDKYGSQVSSIIYGPVTIQGSVPQLAVKYTLLAKTNIRIRYYTVLGQLIKDFGWTVKERGSYYHFWDWKNTSGTTVATSNYKLRIDVEPENLINYFWYYDTQSSPK
ncbi:MAG: hypothetical protein ACE5GL_03820 [Calditrichia bacterium]